MEVEGGSKPHAPYYPMAVSSSRKAVCHLVMSQACMMDCLLSDTDRQTLSASQIKTRCKPEFGVLKDNDIRLTRPRTSCSNQ